MIGNLTRGMAAGAAGTIVLNVSTYLDMALRGRPASQVPAETVGHMADAAGLSLGREKQAQNRRSGLGALFGYATGLAVGGVYGLVRPRMRAVPVPLAALALGGAAMAASDVTAAAAGTTDPRTWGAKAWLADIVPHVGYGLATAGAFERLVRAGGGR